MRHTRYRLLLATRPAAPPPFPWQPCTLTPLPSGIHSNVNSVMDSRTGPGGKSGSAGGVGLPDATCITRGPGLGRSAFGVDWLLGERALIGGWAALPADLGKGGFRCELCCRWISLPSDGSSSIFTWNDEQSSGRVNANFCVYYVYRSSCTQNHGSDAYNVRKKRDSVSTRIKLHEANDHGKDASIVKGKRASFANNISVFRWIVWWW